MATPLLDDELVAAIAIVMKRRIDLRGIEKVGERKDLEPATLAVIGAAFPDRVEKDRKVAIPDWERVGNVDVVIRDQPASDQFQALIELKWAGPGDDIIYEAIYDLFKLSLATGRDDKPRAYLLTGASEAHWAASGFEDLFADAEHDPVELCRRRLPDSRRSHAWDALLAGADDKCPLVLSQGIRTSIVGRAAVGAWEPEQAR